MFSLFMVKVIVGQPEIDTIESLHGLHLLYIGEFWPPLQKAMSFLLSHVYNGKCSNAFQATVPNPFKVELHCRLEGCVRPKTLWDMAKSKSMPMPRETEEEFLEFCGVSKERRNPEELNQWLKKQALTVRS